MGSGWHYMLNFEYDKFKSLIRHVRDVKLAVGLMGPEFRGQTDFKLSVYI